MVVSSHSKVLKVAHGNRGSRIPSPPVLSAKGFPSPLSTPKKNGRTRSYTHATLPPLRTMLQTTYQLPILLLALLCPIANAEIPPIAKRAACEEKSWKPDDGKATYTRPANDTQILVRGISGPVSLQITGPRQQSFTASMDISFADAAALGVGFDLAETVQDSSVFEVAVPEGQNGDWGFTSYLMCTTGECSLLQVRFGAG